MDILKYSIDLIDKFADRYILRVSLRGGYLLSWGLPRGFALKKSTGMYIIYYLDTIDISWRK